ncbi:hypothetical protein RHMOL_Rhmol04G0060700 [Rhododendron molle]|uniref:Uncharacterized protein n=1 Tax=Rhododendron molle TaxID=49168 RepID=A0ACC0NYU1_RHOML|nr:hypothetical protein RHMOL_Rhmol04G0060700 [Rhododendron molle]
MNARRDQLSRGDDGRFTNVRNGMTEWWVQSGDLLSLENLSLEWETVLEMDNRWSGFRPWNSIWWVTFADDDSTRPLFSSCPVLQELALVNCGWENLKTITIHIPTLKRLTIDRERIHTA